MKNTKFAFVRSVIALLLCVSMFVGTTFAWFTDEVVSMNNIIQTGILDVELQWFDEAAGTWKDVDQSTNVFDEGALWEPGYTEVVYLRVRNAGNLALKYQLGVRVASQTEGTNVYNEKFLLSDYIHMGVATENIGENSFYATREAARAAITTSNTLTSGKTVNGEMLKGEADEYFALVVYMPESVGNEANYKVGTTQPTINLGITLLATQMTAESDSFGSDYDTDAVFPVLKPGSVTVNVTPDANNQLTEDVTMVNKEGTISAILPAGTLLKPGTTSLTFSVSELSATQSNVVLKENEVLRSMDVHVEGVAAGNTTPIQVTIKEAAMPGLNSGNYALYHVENGATNEMTDGALNAHNGFAYDPATGDVKLSMATFSEVTMKATTENAWNGKFDYTWYDASKDELIIANADQLAGFGAIVGGMAKKVADKNGNNVAEEDDFSGKTVKLIADINLGDKESENNPNIIFYPIGYNSSDGKYDKTGVAVTTGFYNFCGTFDGNGHKISNFYQNTWEMKGDNNYYDANLQYYRDGMGLFGRVYGGTVKNLTVDNFSSDGEYTTTGVIAAYADGATFENIAITNCNPRVYNIGNGGIVGCVGWYAKEAGLKTTFKNITVDNTNTISALWGSYDVACGGIVGQYYPTSGQTSAGSPKNAGISLVNCHVSAQMDVYNDVCANYQYYAYRYTGMLIGSVRENVTIDGHSYPKMDGITATGCTVHFGTWNDYYYCEIIDNTTASYTHDYQMSRLVEIKAINGTTITYLDGTTGNVPASGRANYVIVDYTKGHGTENATCYHFKDGAVWTHDMGGIQTGIDENNDGKDDLKEDKQHIYLEFNNLFTGYGWGVTSKGITDYNQDEIRILDREVANSVVKFEEAETAKDIYMSGTTITLGELFKKADWEDKKLDILKATVNVTVSPVGEGSTVSGTFVRGKDNWTQGTLTFSGTGEATITITDYYFCTPTTVTVTIREGKTTVTTMISEYAKANSWADATKYTSIAMDENITVIANGGGNTGKYYTNGNNWRIYQNESPKVTVTAVSGTTIETVKITYVSNTGGVLTFNGTNIDSGKTVTVNAPSVTFSVGNTGTATNGQVRITEIEVIYTTAGGNSEPDVPTCQHTNTTTTTVNATCATAGSTTITCDDCGETVSAEEIPATGNHTYVDGICSVCGKTESATPDCSGTYYIATIRTSGNYFYMTSNLGTASTKRYTAVDSGQTTLPKSITNPKEGYVFKLIDNGDGTYCLQAEDVEGNNYLGWTSGNSGTLVAEGSALRLTVDITDGIYNIHFTASDAERYLALNGTSGNNYFAWYKSGQKQNLVLIPVAVNTCKHTNTTTTTVDATCTVAGSVTVTCDDCGATVGTETIIPTSHSYKYEESGDQHVVTCDKCDYEKTENHDFSNGNCVCGAEEPVQPDSTEPTVVATFNLGANGSASHSDGSEKSTYSATVDGYTLSITGGKKMYTGARDAKGNSCIKLGSSSAAGGFTFAVPEKVTSVTIYIAKYKNYTSKITVNGTAYTLSGASDSGAYDAITIDTTSTKTVTLTTVSGGYRAMVNTIEFTVTE